MSEFSTLNWTGERMVPFASDMATQLFHFQRYLFFRPWYEGAKVIDAAGGEGYGVGIASATAESALGVDISAEAVEHAMARYPSGAFRVEDVCQTDYSGADLVLSFETIEHLPDPEKFLEKLTECTGRIVISTPNRKTHSPGNKLSDKPLNPYHTIEWTPNEFAELIRSKFQGREVRFLSQEGRWPGLIREGLDDDAMYCIAVIGEDELPKWPSVGLSMPTLDHPQLVQEAIVGLSQFYPGELFISVVANGSRTETVNALQKFAGEIPHMVEVIVLPENIGYGRGSNTGLESLSKKGFDIYGVINDDIIPTMASVTELVLAYNALQQNGQNPGLIGPVSNNISGDQKVQIGDFNDLASMMWRAESYHREHHSNVTQHYQLRGFFLLISPECLDAIGGFDTAFGIGNFEDDDYCLRAKLAGFTNWIVDGAFIFHHGSQSFKQLEFDDAAYRALMERNEEIFRWKWDVAKIEYWPMLDELPENVSLYVPLDAEPHCEFPVNCNGEWIDLITQASDVEFVKWIFDRMKVRHRDLRRTLVNVIMKDGIPQESAMDDSGSEQAIA